MPEIPQVYCDCSLGAHGFGGPYHMPPEDVNNIPSFINTAEKWDEQVHYCDCIHKFSNLVYDIEQYDLPQADKKKLIYCLAEDCIACHGTDKMFCEEPCKCSDLEEDY